MTWATTIRDTVTGDVAAVGKGSVSVAGGTTKTIEQNVTIRGTHRSEVIVQLASGQQVDFYVTPSSP